MDLSKPSNAMQVKYPPFFLFILLIIYTLTRVPIYGQAESTASNSSTVGDSTTLPYLSAKELSFTDSLAEVLKNNFSNAIKSSDAAEDCTSNFFISKQKEFYEETNRSDFPFDWFFVVLFLFLVPLAFIRLQNPSLFLSLQLVLGKKKQQEILPKTGSLSKNSGVFLLVICSWIGFSIAFIEILSFFDFSLPFEPLFFAFLLIFSYFFSKYLLEKMAAGLFQLEDVASNRIRMAVYANFVWALVGFPLAIINHYTENNYLFWIICLVFCANFLHKLVFSWIILSSKLKLFEILLYLCSIDVLPLLLFARYLMS